MSILIQHGRVVTAENDLKADVYIEGETVRAIDTGLRIPADTIIDATGKFVIPGGIDVHTHLDAPVGGTVSSDDFETGTRAAAFGGTTTIVDFATQSHGEPLTRTLDAWLRKGERSTIDFGLHMIITDLEAAPLDGIDSMVREGISSFKLFMAYPGTLMLDDGSILQIMERTGKLGGLVLVHAENGSVIDMLVQRTLDAGHSAPVYHARTRPPAAEAEATHRAIALAQMAGVPVYIVHVSCDAALQEITGARARGARVYAETCPQYLLRCVDDLCAAGFEGAKYVLTPPLREKWNQEKLWDGLKEDDLQVVATDHCPFNFIGQKDRGKESFVKIPNGGPGIEHRLELLYHHGVRKRQFTLNRWVDISATAPAKLFGLYPRKGTIAAGSDADLVVWNPDKVRTLSAATHHMRVDYSMYEGFTVTGGADLVMSRGEVIVENDVWLGKRGRGKFLKRQCFAGAYT